METVSLNEYSALFLKVIVSRRIPALIHLMALMLSLISKLSETATTDTFRPFKTLKTLGFWLR